MIRVLGIDASLNKTGLVELTDGEMTNYWYATNNHSLFKKIGVDHALSFEIDTKDVDHQKSAILRLIAIEKLFTTFFKEHTYDYIGMEDYALGMSRGSHQLGEVGGLIRMILYKNGVPFRLQDPNTIKQFTTNHGNADKVLMKKAVASDFNVVFKFDNLTDKQNDSVSEDLVDAFAIAQLTWTEVQLRRGVLSLSNLTEGKIRAFNRVTKYHPVNLLGRDWL
jgi:Holliday junction resolvasome RuvABC endonuclease subunit